MEVNCCGRLSHKKKVQFQAIFYRISVEAPMEGEISTTGF
jgi:hypothetical protein